jgi:phosphatidylcholine synthase
VVYPQSQAEPYLAHAASGGHHSEQKGWVAGRGRGFSPCHPPPAEADDPLVSMRTLAAWAVHLYTALGLVIAGLVAVLIIRGDAESFRLAFVLLFLATFIDATDGWLARRVGVKDVLPWFDGRRLDDITDFHTYTSLPLLLIWGSGVIADYHAAWLLLPLLASAYGFSQTDAKTPDGYFRGFPSYWNVVAFYLYFLDPSSGVALGILLLLVVLTFVPAKYLYPSQPGRLNRWTTILGAGWAAVLLLVLLDVPTQPRTWLLASLLFPIFYTLASWTVTVRDWRRPPPPAA